MSPPYPSPFFNLRHPLPPSPLPPSSLVLHRSQSQQEEEENVEGAQEFQEFVTRHLDTLQQSINVMFQRWETRWNQHIAISEQQQDWHQTYTHLHYHQVNRQNWEDQQMWRQVEHQFWEKQSLHSNELSHLIAHTHQEQRDAQITITTDMAYMMKMMPKD